MKKDNNYYITTAIAYTSAKPHIGNIYEIVLTDSLARFKRAQGYDVFFQTGTDEHGQKIEENASLHGKNPKEYVDEVAGVIRGLFDMMNISYDKFIRTTDEDHKAQVQKIFNKLFEQEDLYKGFYEGWYCMACESFYVDSQIEEEGTCPVCGGKIEKQKEETYFFKLSNYQDRLLKHIEENPEFIVPESRKNEMVQAFLKEPLYDLAVTRTSFKWGIPVSFDEGHIVYVWIDALTNYITGIGYDQDGNHGPLYEKLWPADVHVIGKDILRFHTIYWPILLMALDIELPKQIFGHPWLLLGDGKMSKSKGNVVYVDDLVKVFGVDPVRFLMLHSIPYDRDGNLTYEMMIERINTDLANITGNLLNRTISMANKYVEGVVSVNDAPTKLDDELLEMRTATADNFEKYMNEFKVSLAISEVINLFRRCNKYIDETQPWVLAKDEDQKDRLQTVLYNLLDSLRIGSILLQSIIPETAGKMLDQLNIENRSLENAKEINAYPLNNKLVEKPEILFHRLDVKETLEKLESSTTPKKVTKEIPKEDLISFDEFQKMDLRVGTVVEVEKHENADKLYVCQIDLGDEIVQVVSGLVDHYKASELKDKKVIVVRNLAPVNLRGVKSEGMILAAKDKKGLEVISVEEIADGTKVS